MSEDFLQTARGKTLESRFTALKEEIATLGWLTNGSVSPNHPGCWRWTRKVKAKTVAVTLSKERADIFRAAIANHRRLEAILHEMRRISQEVLLGSAVKITEKSSKNRPGKNVPKQA